MMKAYLITDVDSVYDFATVVFAESRNKAKVAGMHSDAFGGADLGYMDINARRIPKLDKYYRGKEEMDWEDAEDRIAMVKDGNFSCSYEYEVADCECEKCPARQWCERNNAEEGEI